jgi:hypothetical protein
VQQQQQQQNLKQQQQQQRQDPQAVQEHPQDDEQLVLLGQHNSTRQRSPSLQSNHRDMHMGTEVGDKSSRAELQVCDDIMRQSSCAVEFIGESALTCSAVHTLTPLHIH